MLPCSTARWVRTARSRGCSNSPTSPTPAQACSARPWRWTRRWPSRSSPRPESPKPATGPSPSEITPGLPAELVDELGLPCFVKPANMGSSVGVTKAKTVDECAARSSTLTYDEWIVVEEGIVGREIEVAVIGNDDPFVSVRVRSSPATSSTAFDDKYVNDVVRCHPAPLTPSRPRRSATRRSPCTARSGAPGWRGATSSSRSRGRHGASSATR
ncbi:MAG: hypothetical protein R2697_14340 [Ilumatobacteraceae bacterium]